MDLHLTEEEADLIEAALRRHEREAHADCAFANHMGRSDWHGEAWAEASAIRRLLARIKEERAKL